MPQHDHSLTTPLRAARLHRLRAARLGGLAWVALVVAALLVGRGLPTRWAELCQRTDVRLEEGALLICRTGVVLLLLWLALLLLSSMLELVAAKPSSGEPGPGRRPGSPEPAAVPRRGVRAARTTALLLALTAGAGVSTAAAAPTSGMAVVQVEQGRQPAPARPTDLALELSASPQPAPARAARAGTGDAAVPGWTPERPVRPTRAAEQVRLWGGTRTAGDQPATVVVHRGDDLWSIVARHLGPGASAGRIAEEVPRWHVANRDVIGTNPDLLLVGQVLTAPDQPHSAPEPPPVRLPSFSGQQAGA